VDDRRALLLFNRGSRLGDRVFDAEIDRLRAAGIDVVAEPFAGREQVAALIAASRGRIDRVIAVGGDGTLGCVAAALLGTGLPLGIIPTGTANDLARTLGLPADPLAAVDVIIAGRTRKVDLGDVNGRPFFNVASIGLSVELAKALDSRLKRRFGRLGYAIAALRVLLRARPFHAWISAGGEPVRVRTLQIAVGNGRYYGGGTAVHVTAAVDDGQLDLYTVAPASLWRLVLMARDFRRGLHGAWREVRTAHGPEFTVATRRPRAVNADGELVTETPARFTVRPGAITVFAP
jgi:diacylglycerol kinase (ATP)